MQFRTRPEGFDLIRKRVIIRMVVVMVPIFAIVSGPGLFSDNPATRETSLIMIPLFTLVIAFTTMTSLKKQKEQFLSTLLTIDENVIIGERLGLSPVTIRHDDIVSIVKAKQGGFVITGSVDKIAVPADMQNYEHMVELLNNLKPITEAKKDYSSLSWLMTLGVIALLAVNFLVKDRAINIISYGLTVILLSWSFVAIQRNRLVDRRTKRLAWVTLIPLLSFAYTLYILIVGG